MRLKRDGGGYSNGDDSSGMQYPRMNQKGQKEKQEREKMRKAMSRFGKQKGTCHLYRLIRPYSAHASDTPVSALPSAHPA